MTFTKNYSIIVFVCDERFKLNKTLIESDLFVINGRKLEKVYEIDVL